MSTPDPRLIPEAVEATRKTAGMSVSELARESHITRQTLDRKLSGFGEFTVPELIRLAEALGVTLRDFLDPASAA